MMLEGADKATCEKLAGILAGKHFDLIEGRIEEYVYFQQC